jgi:hypothetical protein
MTVLFNIFRYVCSEIHTSTNFDAPDAHFDKVCLFMDAQAEKLVYRHHTLVLSNRSLL